MTASAFFQVASACPGCGRQGFSASDLGTDQVQDLVEYPNGDVTATFVYFWSHSDGFPKCGPFKTAYQEWAT